MVLSRITQKKKKKIYDDWQKGISYKIIYLDHVIKDYSQKNS